MKPPGMKATLNGKAAFVRIFAVHMPKLLIYIYIIVVISRQPMNRLKRYHRLGHVALLVEKNNWLDHVGSLGGYVC